MSLDDIQSSYQDNEISSDPEAKPDDFSQTEPNNNSDREIHLQKNEIDEEILEKLDIKRKNKNQEIQEKLKKEAFLNKFKNLDKSQIKNNLEKVISQDFSKIQKLIDNGLINSEQGQNLKKQVLKKAFDKVVQTEKIKQNLSKVLKSKNNSDNLTKNALEEFSKNNPDFFSSNGRKEVLDYLKSGNVNLGKNELNKISEIVRNIEHSAIERYLQKTAHENNLKNSNESAKQRLTANAQKSNFSGNLSKTFTREQIGKMSSEQFTKYEPFIMEQLKKGLIK